MPEKLGPCRFCGHTWFSRPKRLEGDRTKPVACANCTRRDWEPRTEREE